MDQHYAKDYLCDFGIHYIIYIFSERVASCSMWHKKMSNLNKRYKCYIHRKIMTDDYTLVQVEVVLN